MKMRGPYAARPHACRIKCRSDGGADGVERGIDGLVELTKRKFFRDFTIKMLVMFVSYQTFCNFALDYKSM